MFEWVVALIDSWGIPGVFALMLGENLFPPIPSEVIMPLAGFLAGRGSMSMPMVIIAGTLGSVLGTAAWYWIGATVGADRLRRIAARHGRWLTMSPADIDNAIAWFHRHGPAAIFIGRLIPAIRTLISVPAGLAGMPLVPFFLYTIAGSAIWTSILAIAGLILAENYERVAHVVDPVSTMVVVVIVAVYLYRVVTWRPH
ncbi:DedA family protein [Paracoccus sp. TK19116]|uniref:DedA family protein n=1 Tax=Paracoccus albicereus TaxID=2922394 RepID=A0ABT1MPN6_9RHOB|nr:DedA family protein [Paracoccus albicereus]MCQ0969664.1 DedA family protein [Paracoccus albicereus]